MVLDAHPGEHPGGDRVVDGVDRGGVHAHEDLVVGRRGLGEVLAQGGRGLGGSRVMARMVVSFSGARGGRGR